MRKVILNKGDNHRPFLIIWSIAIIVIFLLTLWYHHHYNNIKSYEHSSYYFSSCSCSLTATDIGCPQPRSITIVDPPIRTAYTARQTKQYHHWSSQNRVLKCFFDLNRYTTFSALSQNSTKQSSKTCKNRSQSTLITSSLTNKAKINVTKSITLNNRTTQNKVTSFHLFSNWLQHKR